MNFQGEVRSSGGVFPPPERRQGLFTAVAALLFGSGVFLLFFALYHQGAWGALLASLFMFIGTVICWTCSAISAPAP
jgi:hypothetical protein